jgi:invasion protein IalB
MMFTRYVGCVFAALIAGGSCAVVAAERVPAQAQGSGPRQRVEAQFGEWLAHCLA